MTYLPGKFVWFEHMSHDTPKARAFDGALFNWHTEVMPMGNETYSMIQNGDAGIGGFITAPHATPTSWMSYLSVIDVDDATEKAKAAGAKILRAPMDYGDVGRASVIADPTGAALSLWKGAQDDRADTEKTADGDWVWNELWTPDEEKALAFYEKTFGYTHDAMDMGPMGTYYVLKTGDKGRGGLVKAADPKAPAMWLPYVAVGDCDKTVAKAKSLGAQVLTGPTDIPDIGRFAIFADPLGAAIAVLNPMPR
jgi:predicted enzyme related to lactoylglutathione lyase